jgi:alanine racemase
MNFSSSDIAGITGGRLLGKPDLTVGSFTTDSRQVSFADGLAFIALKGINHDGNDYVRPLYDKGVRVFIVSRLPDDPKYFREASFILSNDTTESLQKLAAYQRHGSKSEVIAVTGSAGKTVVKEWLSEIIGRVFPVVRSPKSYNSQIGVPLSVLKLEDKFRYGIFEAGISLPGEMDKLREIIDPDIGIITNIGDAHSENFPDNEVKAREKLKLFLNASMIIFCLDHTLIRRLIMNDKRLRQKRLAGWSEKDPEAMLLVKKDQTEKGMTGLEILWENTRYYFRIPFTDRASVENAITVAATCFAIGIDPELIGEGISKLEPVAMRMEMKNGINNCQLIEDFYNSDPGSLGMALEYLKAQNKKRSTLILSDFIQSGRNERELYAEVALLIKNSGIDKFIGIGQALKRNSSLFTTKSEFFFTTDEFVHGFNSTGFNNEIILLKGARIFEFERIGKLLEQQVHLTHLEINLDAITHNLNEFRRLLNNGTMIMAMVKAFAYGAGAAEIAGLLEYQRVNYLAVAYTDEGVELRNAGVTLPVMVMNPDPASASLMIKYNLEPELYSFSSLEDFIHAASQHGLSDYPVHIKIDSGMHRLGFLPGDVDVLAERIKDLDCIRIISVFSHLAASEDPELDEFTHKQVRLYLEAAAKISETVGYPFLRHILNTSGILRFPQYQYDMVRPGIGIYGAGRYNELNLKPAGRFITRISQIKRVEAGEPVGYGCTDLSDSGRTIAILPAGYADGLNRKLGNRNGSLYIRGTRVPIIGRVCMDMCMADITNVGAIEGDEAEVFGPNIPIDEVALQCDTIPYEILTTIPARVKRVFFRE